MRSGQHVVASRPKLPYRLIPGPNRVIIRAESKDKPAERRCGDEKMKINKALIGVVASAFVATGAMAADIPTAPIVVAPPAPMATPAFNWTGMYFGGNYTRIVTPLQFGAHVGYNFAFGGAIVGVEGGVGLAAPGVINASVRAKAGFAVGERLLLYGVAGVEVYLVGPAVAVWTAAGGAEFAINHRVSVFAEVGVVGLLTPIDCCGLGLRAGVNFRPGR